MPGYLESVVLVWGIPCLLHVVQVVCACVSSTRRDASTAMHARRMPQMKWNNDMEKENGIQQRSVQQNCIVDVISTAVHCQYFAVLL